MVGNKLSLLKEEINHYLGIPYFSNRQHLTFSNNALVGKGTAKEIALATIEMANEQNIKLTQLDTKAIYNFQKKHHLGIDCSGLVFNLLTFLDPKLNDTLIGTDGKKGVRRLSANLLTSPPNATVISNYDDIQTGDIIRLDAGKHALFIIEKIGNIIHYVHSSDKTIQRGVHLGQITLTDLNLTLNHQTWSDQTTNNVSYGQLFDPKTDGVFRVLS